jgi:hypothetical protein
MVSVGNKKNYMKWKDYELCLFPFVLFILLTAGIHFKFKRLGFCNILFNKIIFSLEYDIKVTRSYCQLTQ